MKEYYLFHQRVRDFEVSPDVFENFIAFVENNSDDKGCQRFQVVRMTDFDRDPRTTYFYSWSINSDFTYLGRVTEVL